MNCPNCGSQNINGSTFCIKCGANLTQTNQNQQPTQSVQQPINQTVQPEFNQNIQIPQGVNQPNMAVANSEPLNYFAYMLAILKSPIKVFKEEESKFEDSKTSLIFTLIIVGIMTIINLVKTIFASVRVASFDWSKGGYKYSWEWANLKDIKWLEVIGKNFLIYACIIAVIAVVFYIGSLIIKKQLNFIKLLSISTTAIIPIVVAMVLGPIGGLVWSHLSIIIYVAGFIYSFIILYELMNNELKLDGDTKVYFNTVCFAIMIIVGYFALMKLLSSSLGSLGSLIGL